MIGGPQIWIPIGIKLRWRTNNKGSHIGRYTLKGIINAMVTGESNMSRFLAHLTDQTWVAISYITSTPPTTIMVMSMIRWSLMKGLRVWWRSRIASTRIRGASGSFCWGEWDIKGSMVLLNALFMAKKMIKKVFQWDGVDSGGNWCDQGVIGGI